MGMDRRYLAAELEAAEHPERTFRPSEGAPGPGQDLELVDDAAVRADYHAELRRVLTRVSRAFGAMPYGGVAHFTFPQPGDTAVYALDQVADNLERFAGTLRAVATGAEANDHELHELRVYLQHAAELGRRMIDLAGGAPE